MSAGVLLGIGACALCAAVLGALLRDRSRELALLLSMGAAAVVLLGALGSAGPVIERILGFADTDGLQGLCMAVMLKAVGLTVLGQLAVRLCKDAGEAALAYGVELAARIAVLGAAMPAFKCVYYSSSTNAPSPASTPSPTYSLERSL